MEGDGRGREEGGDEELETTRRKEDDRAEGNDCEKNRDLVLISDLGHLSVPIIVISITQFKNWR